jgi:hypothetical protein
MTSLELKSLLWNLFAFSPIRGTLLSVARTLGSEMTDNFNNNKKKKNNSTAVTTSNKKRGGPRKK